MIPDTDSQANGHHELRHAPTKPTPVTPKPFKILWAGDSLSGPSDDFPLLDPGIPLAAPRSPTKKVKTGKR